jgi:hypothetical protein
MKMSLLLLDAFGQSVIVEIPDGCVSPPSFKPPRLV